MQDHELSDHFYHSVDTFLQIVGAEQVSKSDIFFRISRVAIGTNIDYSEIQRVLGGIRGLYSWFGAWAKSADRFLSLAEDAERRGHTVTAGENFLRAALLYHFAQLFTRPEDPQRAEGQQKRVQYYRRGAPYLIPPVEQIWIDYENLQLPGYFRPAVGVEEAPVVLMLPGANSVKEELHMWGWEFNQRGLATIALDGPGQGELSVRNRGIPLRLETYHQAVSAAIDVCAQRPGVDPTRVVVWGQGTGGHLAIRAAAHDERVFAAVSLGGGYDFRLEITPTTPADVWEEARDLYGLETFSEVKDYVEVNGSLSGIAERVTCPLLLIHGEADNIVASEEMERIQRESKGHTDLLVFEDGNHSVCNYNLEMRAAMADWVVDRVREAGPGKEVVDR